jgi:hypothetical protein
MGACGRTKRGKEKAVKLLGSRGKSWKASFGHHKIEKRVVASPIAVWSVWRRS